MNCNPFTLGHRYLVEYAAAQCDVLHLFVVEEDRSMFSSQVRLRLVREGTAHLPNVRVHPSGHYMISSATFPTYFLKQEEDATASGLRCYRQYRITGARGVAAGGFQPVLTVGLPALRRWTEAGLALSDAAALTLLALIAGTEDTNMIHRGGLARARQCRVEAEELYRRATPENFRALLNDLDRQYIREHLSPGGCADLLALSLMLFFLEQDGLLA